MNDTTGKAASSLAIAEKRPQRPGGCVGIFFQLFDWNRRLAKKKLFSKKLLPAGSSPPYTYYIILMMQNEEKKRSLIFTTMLV